MFKKRIHSSLLSAVAGILVCAGCGSPSHSDTLSAMQAQAISQQVSQAVTQALSSVSNPPLAGQPTRGLSATLGDIHPYQSSACAPSPSGESCNFPVSSNAPCPRGGAISVSGDIQGTLNNSGTGSFGAQITITPANCSVSNVTFSGDPNITIAGQVSFSNSAPSFPITLMEGGGISFGPNPTGSCQLNVIYKINSPTSCTVTGTVCGQPVSGNC
jgi:hypothetical protein